MRWRRGQGQSFPLYFQAGHYSYGSYRSYSTSGASIGVLANVTKCWLSWDKSAGNLLQKRSCLTRHWSTWENWTCDWKIFLWEMRPCFSSPFSLSLSIGKLYSYSELYSFPAFFRWLCVRMSPLYFASAPLYCAGRGWKHLWG